MVRVIVRVIVIVIIILLIVIVLITVGGDFDTPSAEPRAPSANLGLRV